MCKMSAFAAKSSKWENQLRWDSWIHHNSLFAWSGRDRGDEIREGERRRRVGRARESRVIRVSRNRGKIKNANEFRSIQETIHLISCYDI